MPIEKAVAAIFQSAFEQQKEAVWAYLRLRMAPVPYVEIRDAVRGMSPDVPDHYGRTLRLVLASLEADGRLTRRNAGGTADYTAHK